MRSDPVRLDHSLDLLCGVFHIRYTDRTDVVVATEVPWGAVLQLSLGRLGCSALYIAHVE